MRRIPTLVLMVLAPAAAAAQPAGGEAACAALSSLTIPGMDLQVTKAEWHPAGTAHVGISVA